VHDNSVDNVIGTGANGIVFRDITDGTIEDNTVENIGMQTGRIDTRSLGIYVVFGSGNQVLSNRVENINYSGIRLQSIDFLVDDNIVTDTCMTIGDGGGIYTCWTTPLSTTVGGTISNNIIQRVHPNDTPYSSNSGKGIFLDSGSNNIIIEYNTIFGINQLSIGSWAIRLHNEYVELFGVYTEGQDDNIVRYNDIYYDGAVDLVGTDLDVADDIYDNTLYAESLYEEA
jgi:hypothetical protein